ncbi:RidA family protein [Stenotrophomonas sp. Iso1]|uniref:RidA family protein n=1 Tax=Stenotrophomonas sp. Iso1 TaxID=2977283 RepID=UPI0022B79B41|nr:RidA family protein [Stenotrophomonas sp. Iso1]
MRTLSMALLGLLCTPLVHAADVPLERHSLGSWEADIGFSGVVRDGDTLHVSGIACAGADMQVAVLACYRQLNDILQRFDVDSSHVVKETVYTTDMDALIKVIPVRKTFFADAKYPAATWVQVSRLFDRAHLLEVEWTVRLK